jgi:hypothetical protein
MTDHPSTAAALTRGAAVRGPEIGAWVTLGYRGRRGPGTAR